MIAATEGSRCNFDYWQSVFEKEALTYWHTFGSAYCDEQLERTITSA